MSPHGLFSRSIVVPPDEEVVITMVPDGDSAALGQRFDPNQHDAIGLIPVTDPEQDGVIMRVVRAGYRFGDKVLRPVVVQVGKLAS